MARSEFTAGAADAGGRLDAVVARLAGISRALAARLIERGDVEIDGTVRSDKALRVEEAMRISVAIPAPAGVPEPEAMDLSIAYADDHVLVVSKPAGLVVHPGPGHPSGTLVNALLARAGRVPSGGAPERPGIVHRLDAGTSGLMIVALDPDTHDRLVEALAARRVSRTYLALVEGVPATETTTVDAPIGRSARHRKKMAVVAGGKPAITRFTVLERLEGCALLEVRPETGRTHQIRVHLATIGHAVLGDPVYGSDRTRARGRELGCDRDGRRLTDAQDGCRRAAHPTGNAVPRRAQAGSPTGHRQGSPTGRRQGSPTGRRRMTKLGSAIRRTDPAVRTGWRRRRRVRPGATLPMRRP